MSVVDRVVNVLEARAALVADKRTALFAKMRNLVPELQTVSDDTLSTLRDAVVSDFQRKEGGFLERYVEGVLTRENIPFKAQVHINEEGTIVLRGSTIPDIVCGTPVMGDSIAKYIVLSVKTSTRERKKLDDWTKIHPPKLFLYVTLENDYPTPGSFAEGPTRKLVCATPKKCDARSFKLGFDDLAAEIRQSLAQDLPLASP